MLWRYYVFRRGAAVADMWDRLFSARSLNILYIAGQGFDPRARITMSRFVDAVSQCDAPTVSAELLLLGLGRYELDPWLQNATDENAQFLRERFSVLGQSSTIVLDDRGEGEEEVGTTTALRNGVEAILSKLGGKTDVILDVSSLPRVAYLAIMTAVLERLVTNKTDLSALGCDGVNFQVLVAEEPGVDAAIRSVDPSPDLVTIPGFSTPMYAESMRDWPMVWFPILGENRLGQFEVLMSSSGAIPEDSEICPVIPHPSRGLRRAERLLLEYKTPLFDRLETPVSNILYVSESNPFEAYRQLLGAMERYRNSLRLLGGCRLAVTPLSSKLVTVGAGLACFEMRTDKMDEYGIAIPYAEPMRYMASEAAFSDVRAEVASLVLTGTCYEI